MEKLKTRPFDAAEYLETQGDFAHALQDAVETGDAAYIADTIALVAKARGLTEMACELGMPRRRLCTVLNSFDGPDLEQLVGLARSLGACPEAKAAEAPPSAPRTPAAA